MEKNVIQIFHHHLKKQSFFIQRFCPLKKVFPYKDFTIFWKKKKKKLKKFFHTKISPSSEKNVSPYKEFSIIWKKKKKNHTRILTSSFEKKNNTMFFHTKISPGNNYLILHCQFTQFSWVFSYFCLHKYFLTYSHWKNALKYCNNPNYWDKRNSVDPDQTLQLHFLGKIRKIF